MNVEKTLKDVQQLTLIRAETVSSLNMDTFVLLRLIISVSQLPYICTNSSDKH